MMNIGISATAGQAIYNHPLAGKSKPSLTDF